MARRMKEEPIVHQNRIADEAEKLFSKHGIDNTSMDEIAKMAGYSKATLYVYFKNKEEIVSFLSLKSMSKLRDAISKAVDSSEGSRAKFIAICRALADYQNEYPEYFDMSLRYITIDTNDKENSFYNQAYKVGEEINAIISAYLKAGKENKEILVEENTFVTVFHMWGMISGVIKLASEKKEYIEMTGKLSKKKFLEDGFEKIFKIIDCR